jgi:peroxiredoxin
VALALGPGSVAPPFELPRLDGTKVVRAPEIFRQKRLTVLIFWNRGCPECTAVAMGMQELEDSLATREAGVVGVPFGPDDPVSIRDQLRQGGVVVPQLWDATAAVAARYELGLQHLKVLLVDSTGRVEGVFDDQIPDLFVSVLPAARRLLSSWAAIAPTEAPPESLPPIRSEEAAATPRPHSLGEPAEAVRSALSMVRLDARMRLMSTEGAQLNDRGLYNEKLENGALLLYRYEIRVPWELVRGIEFVPWLRVSNEPDEILMEGAEQLSSRTGTASLNLRHGSTRLTLGAFPLRVAPLLLQRWDRADAPPLGGVSGCGCGGGGSGVSQRSVEVLEPEYTFEGISAGHASRWVALHTWMAVPHTEREVPRTASALERQEARYRRILSGAFCDLGSSGPRDADSGLPSPIGLRVGVVSVEDDGRTLGPTSYRPLQHDELGWVAQVRLAPWKWLSAEAQAVDWELDRSGSHSDGTAYLAGVRSRLSWRPLTLWMDAHRLRTEPDFEPLYRALTYDPNQNGWRVSGGLAAGRFPSTRRERVTASAFCRSVRETDERDAPGLGRTSNTVLSASLGVRPMSDFAAEVHATQTRTERPLTPVERNRGLSLNLRWERWAFLDPELRLDLIRRLASSSTRNIWQMSAWVRVVR